MKRIALFAAALTAFAPAAFAAGLTATETFEVKQYAPNADLTNVTAAQANAITAAIASGDGNIAAQIYSILN
ncbi:hypothetical protein Q9295_11250 [Xinfangfangia sp. CPCC 101601]|uniref:DUF1471 domain-containing protein n=1 Tax=Pseudogemmobacter lacusdianii TaxID=3069608 RepID=A0ABU0VZA3_9RHOB|nr:hypothetical protein [Xinfangfangia sp. CPCC 101601]MDQ2066953.1 hypothetical protein [Xinfangfangia sp. CPCC 101601]